MSNAEPIGKKVIKKQKLEAVENPEEEVKDELMTEELDHISVLGLDTLASAADTVTLLNIVDDSPNQSPIPDFLF